MTWRWTSVTLIAAYLATGFYVVGGAEKAVVRRCGRAAAQLQTSGLHYDLPWPWTRVDRVNLAAVRTLTLGEAASNTTELLPVDGAPPAYALTGDKNLLRLRVSVHYRLREAQIAEFLFHEAAAERRLRHLVEAALSDLVSRSGVDYVHTVGVAELNARLTADLRRLVEEVRLGIDVEMATLDAAEPPARVLAEFLDVSNARAESARAVQEARTAAEQRVAAANADARQRLEAARRDQQTELARARGAAARCEQLLTQIETDSQAAGVSREQLRELTLRRLHWETATAVFRRAAKTWIYAADRPFDLNVLRPATP